MMSLSLFVSLVCFALRFNGGSPLLIGISNFRITQEITLLRRDEILPKWQQTRSVEILEDGSLTVGVVVIDTMGAFVDKISLVFHNDFTTTTNDEVIIIVYDDDTVVWSGSVMPPPPSPSSHPNSYLIDLTEAIRAPPTDKVKLIDTFTYNGDFVALWRVRHLFELVDQFIIVEAEFTHSGVKKTSLHFEDPENVVNFAPYMSKITYVVVRDYPRQPEYWAQYLLGHMGDWETEMAAFWRENYQKMFCRFFLRPPSKTGKKSLIFVSDSDEVLSTDTMRDLMRAEDALPEGHPDSLFAGDNVVHPRLYMFYYNFDTVCMHAWEFPYLLSAERYEGLQDALFLRVVHGEEAVFVPHGGWHLSYFTSYPGIQRKLLEKAHTRAPTHLSCHIVRDSIEHSRDLFGRDAMVALAPRWKLAGTPPAALLPPWWQEMQRVVQQMQAESCLCCKQGES